MKEIKVGLIGFGTVGQGMVRVLATNGRLIESKVGARIRLKAIADLDITTDRGVPLEGVRLTTDAMEVVRDPDIGIIVELIGGQEPARTYILEALSRKKHVVTANKALLAEQGQEIFSAALQAGVQVAFEASVGGAIPIVRALRDGLVAERVKGIYGIINGTSNYVLSEMTDRGGRFDKVLKQAQEKGYAEADPSFDVEGVDAAHKLSILILLAFGKKVELSQIYTQGITGITPQDIGFAREMGFKIKLLAIAKRDGMGLEVRVHPTMIPAGSLLAAVSGVYNAIFIQGEAVGSMMLFGQGAGMMPAGCAVVADLVEAVRNRLGGAAPIRLTHSDDLLLKDMADTLSNYYLRFSAVDRPGVLSRISGVLGDHEISIASMIQKGREVAGAVPVVMMTHEAKEKNVQAALQVIDKLPVVKDRTVMIRVEEKLE